ncbi:hypothetical protein BSMD_028700 [Bacillus subtilis Miyagi-4]|nr:hypothetical protein BSMD_028700 [Bacillus subtilis Miyagi-4]
MIELPGAKASVYPNSTQTMETMAMEEKLCMAVLSTFLLFTIPP